MTQQEYNIDKIISYLSELQTQLSQIPLSKKATVNNNEQPSERRSEEKRHTKSCDRRNEEKKRPSWWVRFREKLKKICKVKNEATNHASDSKDSQGGSRRIMRNTDEDEDAHLEIRKLQSDIGQMISAFKNWTQFQNNMSKSLENDLRSSMVGATLQKTGSIKSRTQDLKEIRRKISALKCQIPSSLYKQSSRVLSITESLTDEDIDEINETGSDIYLPDLHVSEDFKHSSGFEDVVEKFQGLDDFTQKLCLLSFAVFPENREVTRTMLMYWWIGEGFIDCDDSENSVTRILDAFSTKKLLEPVEDERKLLPNSYKMEPHVHSAVIYLAKKMDLFELYNHNGKLIMKKSSKKKVCLVKDSSLLRDAKTSAMKPKTLQTVFNSSERFPDFTFKWFPLMDSIRVLYLGRWERMAERHIEVESTEFLKNMKSLKNLRLASFQGISGIKKIDNSICALQKLMILDLRACYDLQVLPNDIGSLENLIYLDVSECLKLDCMPDRFEKLSGLQVLKGFVISQSDDEHNCAVKHLVNLRKLSITIKNYRFKAENLIESLRDLKQLESLTFAWRARFPVDDRRGEETKEAKLLMGMGNQTKKWGIRWQKDQSIDDTYKFPDSLKKLELECFPETEPPSWLNPKDLKELKRLSIKGGKLSRMSDESRNTEDKWAVEILRLKYLHEFKVEWRDLKDLFPKMTLLEKYKCPKIAFCPTDGNGVWRSQPETSPNM
ncbi:disease resistance RPP13-like protein 4 [Arabidopsis lyrata subsp. lyrata]|nr:disease resistance RPP13-like protein 4 [Arabidopsis lyrata subsp. lyrata]|eukprot:XP_020871522.1 disease resistance RPP13-like protein 4 [Arabidopsis lyrata subsp. lyrata]